MITNVHVEGNQENLGVMVHCFRFAFVPFFNTTERGISWMLPPPNGLSGFSLDTIYLGLLFYYLPLIHQR